MMSIAASIKKLLDAHQIQHRIYNHPRTVALEQTAEVMGIAKSKILTVKLLADKIGILMAIYPLDRRIDFTKLRSRLNRNLRVLPDFEVNRIFGDCETGSRPPFGELYGLNVIIEKSIEKLDIVYYESGSHSSVIQMKTEDYLYLNAKATRLSFIAKERQVDKEYVLKKSLEQEHTKLFNSCILPDLPLIARKLLEISLTGVHSTQELVDIVTEDECITQQILNYSKLPFFQLDLNKKNHSVEDLTVNVLGFDRVSHIALGVAASRAFEQKKNVDLDVREFWRHAFYAAVIAEKLTALAPTNLRLEPHVSYLAGLFHNFGYLLFSQLFPPEFRLLNKWTKLNPKISIHVLEKKLLGMGRALYLLQGGHAQLGELLLKYWNMPEVICVITREHHSSKYCGKYANYVKVIQLTNQILRTYGIGDGQHGGIQQELLKSLNLEFSQVEEMVKSIIQGSKALEHMAVLGASL